MKNQIKKWLPLLLAVMMTAALFAVPVSAVDVTVKSYPSISHMKIDGTPVVGQKLTFSYDLYDPENAETSLVSKLLWYQQDGEYYADSKAITAAYETTLQTGGVELTIPESAAGKYIAVRVPLSSIQGNNGRIRTIGVGPILTAEEAAALTTPKAMSATIENASASVGAVVGEPLEGHYLYAGKNTEGASRYSWALSNTERGTYTPIAGATEKSYIPKAEDMGKYLRFTVTPVDNAGNEGEAVDSVTKPIIGNAAYSANVSGDGGAYNGLALNSITNGIETDSGGRLYMYGKVESPMVIDLGENRVLKGVSVSANITFKPEEGDAEPTISLYGSMTGASDSFESLHSNTAIEFRTNSKTDFAKPVQTRFVYFTTTKARNLNFKELALLEALPTSLTAEGSGLQVEENATEADVRAALADKLTVTAAYDGDVSYEIPLSSAKIDLNTTGAGTKN